MKDRGRFQVEVTTHDRATGLRQEYSNLNVDEAVRVIERFAEYENPPTPPRSEYRLQHVSSTNGNTSVTDLGVSLVPAHSLRSGDEVEWAPGDWRAIDWVRVDEHWVGIDAGDWTIGLRPVDLVAVRRSGVTG